MSRTVGDETKDLAEITAKILDVEKRAFAESQVNFQIDFEMREAKFNADLESLATKRPQGSAKLPPIASWLLARKCWAWLHRD
jgi:hypothetical protein